jgi:hypothetical protein
MILLVNQGEALEQGTLGTLDAMRDFPSAVVVKPALYRPGGQPGVERISQFRYSVRQAGASRSPNLP